MKKSNKVTSLRSSGISTLSARGPSRADPPSEHEPPATSPDSRVSSEVVERARRRGFTAEYKYRILREATAATGRGEMGALLRREGLYSSHLTTWRIQAGRGEMAALKPQQRGPKPVPVDARDKRIAEFERDNARLGRRAERAEAIVELQKKVAVLLGIALPTADETK
jgi:transposase-like protein